MAEGSLSARADRLALRLMRGIAGRLPSPALASANASARCRTCAPRAGMRTRGLRGSRGCSVVHACVPAGTAASATPSAGSSAQLYRRACNAASSTHARTHTHTNRHARTRTRTRSQTHTLAHTHAHAHKHTRSHTHTHTLTNTHAHAHTHTHTNGCTHARTHPHAPSHACARARTRTHARAHAHTSECTHGTRACAAPMHGAHAHACTAHGARRTAQKTDPGVYKQMHERKHACTRAQARACADRYMKLAWTMKSLCIDCGVFAAISAVIPTEYTSPRSTPGTKNFPGGHNRLTSRQGTTVWGKVTGCSA
jgi:hypothetical protein